MARINRKPTCRQSVSVKSAPSVVQSSGAVHVRRNRSGCGGQNKSGSPIRFYQTHVPGQTYSPNVGGQPRLALARGVPSTLEFCEALFISIARRVPVPVVGWTDLLGRLFHE